MILGLDLRFLGRKRKKEPRRNGGRARSKPTDVSWLNGVQIEFVGLRPVPHLRSHLVSADA